MTHSLNVQKKHTAESKLRKQLLGLQGMGDIRLPVV